MLIIMRHIYIYIYIIYVLHNNTIRIDIRYRFMYSKIIGTGEGDFQSTHCLLQ